MSFESEFDLVPLGEVAMFINGDRSTNYPKGDDYVADGIPFISAADLSDGRVQQSSVKRISTAAYDRLRSGKIRHGDVLFCLRGSIGKLAFVREEEVGAIASSLVIVRARENIDARYLYFILCSQAGQQAAASLNNGSVQPNLSVGELQKVTIPLPLLTVQREIAATLDSFDDRIILLRETNKTLEGIAQAIFKSWFIDFDPVRAKMEGRTPAGMDEETAALFPDELVESELGLVPKGWGTSSIEGICSTITNGGTPSRSNKSYWDAGSIPWYKTGDFSDGFLLEPTEKITEAGLAGSSVKLLPENAVLMAIYAAPTVGRLGVLTRPSTFNQACTGMVAKNNVGTWFLYWTLFFGRDWFNSRANGAAQQNISKAIVAGYTFPRPTDELLAVFHNIADSIHMKVRSNVEQVETLAAIRDSLLPRLISGKLRVDAATADTL